LGKSNGGADSEGIEAVEEEEKKEVLE